MHNAVRLTAELRDRGYQGSERSVRRLLQSWRAGTASPTAVAANTPKPRHVTGWIIRPAAERLSGDGRSEVGPQLDLVELVVGTGGSQ